MKTNPILPKIGGILSLALIMCGLQGCDTEQSVPAYLYIDSVELNVQNPLTQGASTSKILDAWVYANDNLVGGFRLPATVPIIGEGNTRITVLAGIAENGNFTTPTIYPYYSQYNTTLNLKPSQLDTLRPVVSYSTPINNFWIADFEQENKFRDKPMLLYTKGSMEVAGSVGNQYGLVRLGDTTETVCGMNDRISPDLTKEVWVEMDFKGTNSISVGVIGYDANNIAHYDAVQKTIFTPQKNWTKVYFALGREMLSLQQNYSTTRYQVVLFCRKDKQNGVETEINVDNIKVLYF